MDGRNWQVERFEEHRPHLQAVAYRMLGSVTEAEDALQEAWVRLSRADTDAVDNLAGWLTTVVGRVCLDMLRARRSRREDYVGTWLPEPIVFEG
jgi:RNA polymerase sigma factor (sigma-70 family)